MEINSLQPGDVESFIDELWIPAQRELVTGTDHILKDDIRQDGVDHRYSRLSEDETITYLARRDDQLIGFVAAEIETPPPIFQQLRECHVSELFVREDARRQGIAGDLLDAIEEWAITKDCRRLDLNVGVANHPAKVLYEAEGYAVTRYNMKKQLSSEN